MALAVSNTKSQIDGTGRLVTGQVTFDSSYLTGGELFPPSLLGMYAFSSVLVEPGGLDATHAFLTQWNGLQGALSTIKVFWGDNANGASAQFIEVTSTTNLGALVCQFAARGN